MHRQTEQGGEDANLDHDPENGAGRSFANGRVGVGTAWIELHHARGIGNRFYAGKGEHDPDEARPVLPETTAQRLQVSDCFVDVWNAEEAESDHHDRGWDRD